MKVGSAMKHASSCAHCQRVSGVLMDEVVRLRTLLHRALIAFAQICVDGNLALAAEAAAEIDAALEVGEDDHRDELGLTWPWLRWW